MSDNNENQKRKPSSTVKMLGGIMVVLVISCVLLAVLHRRNRLHSCRLCTSPDLTGLARAMQIYGNDYEGKPVAAADANELKRVAVNYRTPKTDADLEYWLKNMVWIHGFSNQEIAAATGLAESEIIAALKKFDIRPDNPADPYKGPSLRPWPYPGGRHPRIGFLEGAIDPQRETKFSVVTPWDPNSYVVVDVPEAIWSNLGLTYLAHTHIDTIWTEQGIELKKLEWNREPNGSLDIERKLPNGIAFGVNVRPTKEAVRMEMWLTNGTDQKLTDLRVQICQMTKMAKGFEQQANDNKVLTNPYVACHSGDGKRWIITAWEPCHRPWGNADCPCFHSDPKFPDLEPGQTGRLRGWLSFYEGTDIQAEFDRIEKTGWRKP
ncbi:MAG: hypothetical protein JSU94_00770 [Phycisphaerales bacterium]|nr:MAG: hypothetical protein JSU94_00770 [Phycisphaerales bacterium]